MMEQRAGASVRASMDFNGPLNALSTSPNNRLIAVGGRDVLKVVALEASGFTEKRNLRVVGKPSLNFSTNDIRWHPHSDYLLATAATNGAVVIWNLEREGYKHVQERVLNGHRRAVNRICWHTSDWNVLISGSQDGTVKLWDKRGGKVVSTYQPKSESVRDVRASPFHPNKFAAAFENGIVQVWDMRKNSQPELKFTAHKGLVLSIDWHPTDANVLASGGRDRYVKIWELGDVWQPKQTIQTIASVGRVAWRPTCVTHIATSASLMDNSIHVWDTKRPFIPVASMKGHSDIASGISWMDTPVSPNFGQPEIPGDWEGHDYWQHMLACSKDGTLKLHSLADSFKPHQSLPTTALALNSKGQVGFSHDYIDRSCASLKIHRHFSLGSSLFTVAGVSSASPAFGPTIGDRKQGNGPLAVSLSPYHSSIGSPEDANGSGQEQSTSRTTAWSFGGGSQQPPLPPKGLSRAGGSSANLTSLSSGTSIGANFKSAGGSSSLNAASSLGSGGIARGSGPVSSSQPNGLQGGGNNEPGGNGPADANFVSVSNASASLLSASPVTPMTSGSVIPRAFVALVTMQNVNNADQLEKIFLGDETEYVQAGKQVEAMRAQFEQGQYLKESFGFDEHTFRFLAKHYVLFPESGSVSKSNANVAGCNGDVVPKGGVTFAQMCAHNALAAFVTGNSHLCQMWRILEVLYANEEADTSKSKHGQRGNSTSKTDQHYTKGFDSEDGQVGMPMDEELGQESQDRSRSDSHNDDQSDDRQDIDEFGHDDHSHANHGHNNASETTMLLEQLDHVNPQAMEGFDPYPYDPRGRHANENGRDGGDRNGTSGMTSVRGNSSMMNGSAVMGDLGHLRDDVLKELLEYYTEIGDLQSCVAITVVVNKVTSVEKVMGKAWLQHIYMHYIDLLHQLQIYTTANELVANCSDQSIRQMNMKSTSVYFNCARCSKPLESSGPSEFSMPVTLCASCSNAATLCSIWYTFCFGLNCQSEVSTFGVLCARMVVTWSTLRSGLHTKLSVQLGALITAR
ncbi:GATOR complex protein WDR24 [Phytophthora citrophthora]|uniref:GATOR complex protein WDR24 n=1 Tax=Phytophthora citrophthora TaxID=4793 RepID=A0AAD9LG56_9STRA|nr:GATOR complex protein WDR24 [Phytophthora citrophthora]